MKRKKGMSLKMLFGLIVLCLTTGLGVISMQSPSDAAANKLVQMKRDYWEENRIFSTYDSQGGGWQAKVTVSIDVHYLFWPGDSDQVNRVAPVSASVCYTMHDAKGISFDGVSGNPIYMDDNNQVNPGEIWAPNVKGDDHACDSIDIPNDMRRWLRMDQEPRWGWSGKVRLKLAPDQNFTAKTDTGSDRKYFKPGQDINLGDPFYCECDYPGKSH